MTWHQYEIVKALQRIWRFKRLSGNGEKDVAVTKQAEIEIAGQSVAERRPPLAEGDGSALGLEREET